MRSPRGRHHGGGRRGPSSRKYDDDDAYSAYESDRRTPFSEYESRTNGKRTVYSEYTTDADYLDGDRSSYSESDNGKRTPYSEFVTEYSDETDDDRMSGTLGIARNQYCTTLNGLVEGSDSSSSESSYSQSTFASDFDRMCNANVNTNCMATLFNRNTDVPGTIQCGHGEHSESHPKMSLPIPLHYMDHLVPSKQELNSAIDNFAQKFDTGDEERPGFPQVYKSLFEANLSQTASNEDEERVVGYTPRRKPSDRNRSQELTLGKAKREASSKVEKVKDPEILSPPSHIIIKDDFTAVSSAESFGFAPETQKPALGGKRKNERREVDKRHTSSRHSSPRHGVVPHRPSPRHATSHRPSPRHSSSERPLQSSPLRAAENSKSESSSGKPDARVGTRHGLDRLMRKQGTSPSKRNTSDKEENRAFKVSKGLKSPISSGRVVGPSKGNSNAFSFSNVDETRQDTAPSNIRQANPAREVPLSGIDASSQLRAKPHRHLDRRNADTVAEEDSRGLDERLVSAKHSIGKVSSTQIGKQLVVNSEAAHPSQKNSSLIRNEYDNIAGAREDTNEPLWRNSANSIPHVLSLKQTQTAVSELSGQGGDFPERRRVPAPIETAVGSAPGNPTVNIQILTLKQTQTGVSELTGEAGDFGEATRPSVPLVHEPRGEGSTSKMAHDFDQPSLIDKKKSSPSRFVISEGDNISQAETPSRRKRGLVNGFQATEPSNATKNEPASLEAETNDFVVSMKSVANKKAETLDRLEDALMGSRKSGFSHQQSRREGFSKNQDVASMESQGGVRLTIDDQGTGRSKRKPEGQLAQCTVIKSQVEQTMNSQNHMKSKPTQQERLNSTRNQQEAHSATVNVILSRPSEIQTGEGERASNDSRHSEVDLAIEDAMCKALSPNPELFSSRHKDVISEDRSDKETQELRGDDPTSLSALENEISILESQITGLEQDQISEAHLDQVSIHNKNRFKDQIAESEKAPTSSVEVTHTSMDHRLPNETPKPQSVFSEPGKKRSGDYHFKPPKVPIQQEDQTSKPGRKQKDSSNLKGIPIQNKSTDATLVTAPTVMSMDTPFTMNTPLVLSPTTAKRADERRWDRNSSMLVATAIALPSERRVGDRSDDAPFFFIFNVGTQRYFVDLVFIIIAWMRHLASMGFIQRQHGSVQVALMVPPITENDLLYEEQLQRKSLGTNHFTSPSSEEPGTVVEPFVPEIWEGNSGRKLESFFPPMANKPIWNQLFGEKKTEATHDSDTGGRTK